MTREMSTLQQCIVSLMTIAMITRMYDSQIRDRRKSDLTEITEAKSSHDYLKNECLLTQANIEKSTLDTLAPLSLVTEGI